jgi:hypothetical protein
LTKKALLMNDENRRQALRLRKFKAGTIFLGTRGVPCTVRSLSETGARLQVQTTYGIPAKFELVTTGEPRRACRVTWLDETTLGVEFEQN